MEDSIIQIVYFKHDFSCNNLRVESYFFVLYFMNASINEDIFELLRA